MCKKYDLRFIVIHDRYDYPNKTRTIEVSKFIYDYNGFPSVIVYNSNDDV